MHTLAFIGPCGRQARRNFLVLTFSFLALGGLSLPGAASTNSPAVPAQASADNPLPLIRTVRQLLDLPKRESQRHYPVELRAVVTYFDAETRNLFVQDETAGVWVYPTFQETNLHAGDLLRIQGISDAVNVSSVRPREISKLGTAPLPAPHAATYDRLVNGAEDCQRVQTRGVIRSMSWQDGLLLISLVSGHDCFVLYLPHFHQRPMPTDLVGAEIQADGVCSMKVNPEGNMVGFWFYVQETNHLTILRPGAADPYQLDVRPVRSLWTYGARDSGAQIHVRGTVTHAELDRLFLRDESGPLQARLRLPWEHGDPKGRYHDPAPPPLVRPGDIVDAWGYLSPGIAPGLVDAEYQRTGSGIAPPPVPLRVREAVAKEMDGQLITVVGQLLERESYFAANHTNRLLILEADGIIFEADLTRAQAPDLRIAPNSMLRLTGINSLQAGAGNQLRPFRLLLRQAGDLTVLRAPPFLTFRNAGRLGAIGAFIALVAIGWSFILHRQVRRQTIRLSERTAELSEVNARLVEEINARRRFVSVIEATTELVGMATMDGRALYLNPAGRRLLEIPEDFDITGLNTWEFYPEDANLFFSSGPFQQCILNGAWVGETRMLTRSGREIPVSLVGLAIKAPDGTPEHIAGIAHDITARKRVEEDLRTALAAEQELNQLKSNFVSIVSHEFRSPLGAILSSAELLRHYSDRLTPPRRGQLLEDIIRSTNEMARMMEDVLLLSRVESVRYELQPRPLALAELCQRLSDEVSSATHARCPIQVRLGPLPERARGDEGLLRHILNNLLSNAVKYSPAGALVEFGVEQDQQEAVFTVRDRGIGIPIEDQPRLFQAFHRGNNVGETPGTGLGLVIVQRCVALHGGALSIQSQPGAGTTVTVRLPLFSNDSAPSPLRPRREPAPPTNP